MTPRLTAGFWVQAYLHRLGMEMIPVYVVARGDEAAGAVLVKLNTLYGRAKLHERRMTLDGREWFVMADGPEAEIDASIAKQRRMDPDLWVIEVESAQGRTLLDEPGLD